jgi:hypothetical protein
VALKSEVESSIAILFVVLQSSILTTLPVGQKAADDGDGFILHSSHPGPCLRARISASLLAVDCLVHTVTLKTSHVEGIESKPVQYCSHCSRQPSKMGTLAGQIAAFTSSEKPNWEIIYR